MSWRERARSTIADTIKRVGTADLKALRKALVEVYPFGERANHPYQIWLDEIKRQLGLKDVKDKKGIPKPTQPLSGQEELF